MSPSKSLSVVPISVRPSHGSTNTLRPPPAGAIAPACTGSASRGHDHVGAAAGPDDRHLGLAVQLLRPQPVGPHAGGVDDVRGAHGQLAAAHGVAHHRAAVGERDRLDPVRRHRAEALGLGEHGEHEPHVVGLAVVEQVAAGGLAAGERGQELEHLRAVDDPVALRAPVVLAAAPAPAPVDRHHVVGVQPDPEDAVGPRAVERGDDERQRPDEVRRQRGQQLALEQRLADQPEVERLQVAQPAVDELARARGGPARVVALLDERDGVAAARRVERDAGAGDPAADDEHVERLVGERGEGVGAREHQARWATTSPTGARSGAGFSPRASPRCSSPSTASPSGIPHAARPSGVRRTPGVRQ